MKSTIKFAALGVCALAATSTAAFAQEIPTGFTAGIDLASPLPTGIFAIDINAAQSINGVGTVYAAVPGLIWSSPWSIAGAKFGMTGLFAYASFTPNAGDPSDGPWASIVEANLKWNFGALSVSENAGIFYEFDSNFTNAALHIAHDHDTTNFTGSTDFAYKFGGGVEGLLNIIYGNANASGLDNNGWLTFEGAVLKKFGKMEVGPLVTYSENFSGTDYTHTQVGAKVGYAFDGFNASFRVLQTTEATGTAPNDTMVFIDFVKPLWVAEESLK